MQAVIARTDLLNNPVMFLANTHDREKDTIQYWDGKKGSKPSVAPIAFYKSTKPIDKPEEVQKLVQNYSKEFGEKEVIVRQRLVKEPSVARNPDGSVNMQDVNGFKKRLADAIIKAINEAL